MNITENMMLSTPGGIGLIWLIQLLLRRPVMANGWQAGGLICQATYAIGWILVAIVTWLYPGGHPPAAGMAAILGVLVTLVAAPLCIVLCLISWHLADEVNSLHVEVLVENLLVTLAAVYVALFVR